MVVLKKIRGATLMETLVASVLIVIVFMISSLILNNLFSGHVRNNTAPIAGALNELQYLQMTNQLALPYEDQVGHWSVSVERGLGPDLGYVLFQAVHNQTGKSLERRSYEYE